MYVIAVNKSQEMLMNVRRLPFIVCDDDAAVFTSTRRIFFDDDARFDFDDECMFVFRRRLTLISSENCPRSFV